MQEQVQRLNELLDSERKEKQDLLLAF